MDRIEYLKLIRKQMEENYKDGYISTTEYFEFRNKNNELLAEERIKRLYHL